MPTITPFLWFDADLQQVIDFYRGVFPDTRVHYISATGPVQTAEFEINGQHLMAINGGPTFTLNEAFSLFVSCETQAEIDRLWDALIGGGGEPSQCGWLKDRFGLSWQIVPASLLDLIGGPDPAKAHAATQAMLAMQKLDIATLQRAFRQRLTHLDHAPQTSAPSADSPTLAHPHTAC